MCRLFIGADSRLWETEARDFQVDGVAVSLEMELFYWRVLDRIAARDAMTTSDLINRLYLEAIDADHTTGSFASFLRVCAGRFLDLLQRGEIPDDDTPIRELDAEAILDRETMRENGGANLRVVYEADIESA